MFRRRPSILRMAWKWLVVARPAPASMVAPLVLAAAAACASPSKNAVVPPGHEGRLGSEVRTLAADHFTLDVPASWERGGGDILGLAGQRLTAFLQGTKEKDLERHRFADRVELRLEAHPPGIARSVRVYWSFKDWVEAAERVPSVKPRRRVSLPAGEALELRTDVPVPGFPPLETLDYYLQSPAGAWYGVRFFSAAEGFDEQLPLFQAIARSFRWTPIRPIRFAGFSFAPPSPSAWNSIDRTDREMHFIRRPLSATHTVNARVWRFEFPEAGWGEAPPFQDLVRGILALKFDRPRYANPRITLSQDARDECVRYGMQVEDRGVPDDQGQVYVQIDEGLYCQHPTRARLIIELSYRQRFRRADERPGDIAAEFAEVLAGLQFTSLD